MLPRLENWYRQACVVGLMEESFGGGELGQRLVASLIR
jgi:hypothetical protein